MTRKGKRQPQQFETLASLLQDPGATWQACSSYLRLVRQSSAAPHRQACVRLVLNPSPIGIPGVAAKRRFGPSRF